MTIVSGRLASGGKSGLTIRYRSNCLTEIPGDPGLGKILVRVAASNWQLTKLAANCAFTFALSRSTETLRIYPRQNNLT